MITLLKNVGIYFIVVRFCSAKFVYRRVWSKRKIKNILKKSGIAHAHNSLFTFSLSKIQYYYSRMRNTNFLKYVYSILYDVGRSISPVLVFVQRKFLKIYQDSKYSYGVVKYLYHYTSLNEVKCSLNLSPGLRKQKYFVSVFGYCY